MEMVSVQQSSLLTLWRMLGMGNPGVQAFLLGPFSSIRGIGCALKLEISRSNSIIFLQYVAEYLHTAGSFIMQQFPGSCIL
jgi:hypothetical protein